MDAPTVRLEPCEEGPRKLDDVNALKADIVGLRRYVDELKSTYLTMFFGTVDLTEVPSTNFLAISEIPLATMTEDTVMVDDDVDSKAPETDEDELGTRDAELYDDLEDLEGEIVQTVVESL
ncbi:uncharacterized protein LOC125823230 [Solanum verrucosum]|uniref:uncharacterized protein LOC125823230 n=1 Tax=Solanum verrucosum TaxID=315347 RepID=UPI0020D07899|nr:uncharacterized protein LOC125823230 [Solanum verrucosum]